MSDDPSQDSPRPIYVVSDSSGDTAEMMVRAALAQFEDFTVSIKTFAHVTESRRIETLVKMAADEHALIAFTLVQPEAHARMNAAADKAGVAAVDLIGPLMARIAPHLGDKGPRGIPGLKNSLSADYFRRIEAVEFTVKHDDGAEPRNLFKADIVLVGVSRTSKTPTSTYLAQRGYKVANVPLVLGIDPPPELYEVDQDKIFGLTIEPESLHGIRMARIKNLGIDNSSNYGHLEHIYMELEFAHEIFRRNPTWPVIDVSRRAVEETASVILKVHNERRKLRSREQTIRG